MTSLEKLLILTALSTPAAASADDNPVKNMECLVGAWKGAGTYTIGKDRAPIQMTWTCRRVSGEAGVLCDLDLTGIPGLERYRETDLFGYEPHSKTYHWYSVTNAGETHDHVAPYTRGDAIEFVYTGHQEGKPFREVIQLRFGKDARTMAVRAETFLAGRSTGVLQVHAKK